MAHREPLIRRGILLVASVLAAPSGAQQMSDESTYILAAGRRLPYLYSISLADALDALERDHQFLIRDEVFPESLIRRWLEIKRDEINAINQRPHPYEFTMYFDF